MTTEVIVLLGFPGTGKYTVAKELRSHYAEAGRELRVIDNHYTANIIFGILPVDGVRSLPATVWDHVGKVRSAVWDAIVELSPPEWSFVFTTDISEREGAVHLDQYRAIAEARGSTFAPVRLLCDVDELAARIVSPERRERLKMTDPDGIRRKHATEAVLDPGTPETLTIDTTASHPQTTARAIREHVESLATRIVSPDHPPMDLGIRLSDANEVFRFGDTVVRPVGPATPAVHALLRHLEAHGYPAAPRLVAGGVDAHGRQRLTYVEGAVVHPRAWSDEAIFELGRLLRLLHDTTAAFVPPPDAMWFKGDLPRHGDDLVISHGDVGPWNVVARDGLPIAFIDWEWAGPVPRLDEVASVALLNCQLHGDEVAALNGLPPAEVRANQLRLFADAYGLDRGERERLIAHMIEIAIRGIAYDADEIGVTPKDVGPHPMVWGMAWKARGAVWILEHRTLLEGALLG